MVNDDTIVIEMNPIISTQMPIGSSCERNLQGEEVIRDKEMNRN